MDYRLPDLDFSQVRSSAEDFKLVYRNAKEELPPMMPAPRGMAVETSAFVDASHAANKKTRKSHTGFIIFVNKAPILWYSKRQNTVEASSFSSEMVAMRIALENIESLKYKLRMFGVPLPEPANVYGDNRGVILNTSVPESTLNK